MGVAAILSLKATNRKIPLWASPFLYQTTRDRQSAARATKRRSTGVPILAASIWRVKARAPRSPAPAIFISFHA